MLDCVACKEKRNELYYFTYLYIMLNDFINCPAFVDINPIQDGLFRGCSRMGGVGNGGKKGVRTVPRRTFPRRTHPRLTLPRRTLPLRTLPRRTLPRWTFPRLDTSPTDTSPTDTSRMDTSPMDISPTRHIPDGRFPDQIAFYYSYPIVTYFLIVIFIYVVN